MPVQVITANPSVVLKDHKHSSTSGDGSPLNREQTIVDNLSLKRYIMILSFIMR